MFKGNNLRRGCRLQDRGAVQRRSESRLSVSSLIVAAGERRGSLGVGFQNMMCSWVMEWGVQQGLGVVASQ